MMKKFLIITFLLGFIGIVQAQGLFYNIRLTHYFDNREYNNPYADPQTLFGIRISPEMGWKKIDQEGRYHQIKIGVHYLQPIGSQITVGQWDPIIYYQYQKKGNILHFGIIPYSKLIERIPLYVMSDSLSYVYPNINGALFQYKGDKGFFEGILDWRGAMSTQTREAFRIILKGRYYLNRFSIGGITFLNHLSNKAPNEPKDGVCDDYFISPEVGFHLDKNKIFDTTSIKISYIFASTRERITNTQFKAHGIGLELFVKWRFLALQNSVYLGNNLLPFYDKYGSGLHLGDSYYKASRYNRTSLMIYLIQKEFVTCSFSWNLHFIKGYPIGHQQLLNLAIDLDALTFKN
jgi:hypothetical protein